MEEKPIQFVMLPEQAWRAFCEKQEEIIEKLRSISCKSDEFPKTKYITALQFMKVVSIKRSKFDQLVRCSKIKIIRKGRKIYVPFNEIDRYFGVC